MDTFVHTIKRAIRIKNIYVRVALAEFLGTCILIVFGDGSVAQSVLSNETKGEFISINWSWCMAVTFGVYASINVSGGHINPAISLAMTLIGRLPWKMLPIYMLAQYLGAIVGASVVYLVYFEAMDHFEQVFNDVPTNSTTTASIFSTYPQDYLTAGEGFADQVVGTAMLMLIVMAVTDKRNANVPKAIVPLLIGLGVFVIGAAYGYNCGYAINPARDLGPRIFTAMARWGIFVFNFRDYNWFWVPIVGPHVGAFIGAVIYLVLIEAHWEDEEVQSGDDKQQQQHKKDAEVTAVDPQGSTNASYDNDTIQENQGQGEDTRM